MAQSGFSPILIYGSTTTGNTPSASNLTTTSLGVELAINATDGKLFYKDNAGNVQTLATKATGTIGGSNTQVQYNSSGLLAGSANMVFDGSTLTTLNSAYTGTLTGGTGVVNLGSGQFYKDASGNVGVGLTPKAWGTIKSIDMLGGGASETASFASGFGSTYVVNNAYYNGSAWIANTTSPPSYYSQISGTHQWYTGTSVTAGTATTFTERMRIDSTGNVGIGTTSPNQAKLTVNGIYQIAQFGGSNSNLDSVFLGCVNRGTTSGFSFLPTGSAFVGAVGNGIAIPLGVATFGAQPIIFGTNNTESMRIGANGAVNIGGTTTGVYSEKLMIQSASSTQASLMVLNPGIGSAQIGISAASPNLKIYNTYSTGTLSGGAGIDIDSSGGVCIGTTASSASASLTTFSASPVSAWFQSTNAATSGVVCMYSAIPTTAFNSNCAHFAGQTSGINTWYLYGNGATSYVSDANLKKNIVTTRDGYLDDLAKLRVVKYQWKANSDDSQVELGLIAQEVAEVFPALVQDSISVNEGDAVNKVILGSVFQPIIIKSVQELYSLVQEQQVLITDLTTRLAALENK